MLKKTLNLLNSTAELRKLIIENPDLPLVVFAGESASTGGCSSTFCSNVRPYIGAIINCENNVCKDRVCEEEEFEDALFDKLEYEHPELDDDELYELLEKKISEYGPYLEKCIILYVDN